MGPASVVDRRRVLAGLATTGVAGVIVRPARAALAYYTGGLKVPPGPIPPSPDVSITYGQSHTTNEFPSFGAFSFPTYPGIALQLHVSHTAGGGASGLLPSAGILTNEYAQIDGIASFQASDNFAVGRMRIISETALRAVHNASPSPLLEYCHGYPGCTWEQCADGIGLGLAPLPSPSGNGVDGPTKGIPWWNGVTADADLTAFLARGVLTDVNFRDVYYLQGGALTDTIAQKQLDLASMMADYDALGLRNTRGWPLHFFLSPQVSTNYSTNIMPQSFYGCVVFARANANGRTWAACPIYQWPIKDTVHLNDYGSARCGEAAGYAQYVVYDEAASPPGSYKPLWQSLTTPISVAGQVITIPFDRPSGNAFASGTLAFYHDATDGLIAWPQQGFQVYRNGVALTVSPAISGLNVNLTISETLNSGDSLEVSYAYRAPAGLGVEGNNMGVGGNLRMTGPASLLFAGKTIDSWAWPLLATVTV